MSVTRIQSKESWAGWFSLAIRSVNLTEILNMYESRPDGALEYWQQHHESPDWLMGLIARWELYKTKTNTRKEANKESGNDHCS